MFVMMDPHFEQQFADLIFALGCGLVQRRELPQVGHVHRSSVSDQQLSHLVVTVGARVVERNQTAGGAQTHVKLFTQEEDVMICICEML